MYKNCIKKHPLPDLQKGGEGSGGKGGGGREKGAACRFAARSASSNNCRSRSFSFFNTSMSRSSRAMFSAVCSSATSTK
jgi:hypothetical protein